MMHANANGQRSEPWLQLLVSDIDAWPAAAAAVAVTASAAAAPAAVTVTAALTLIRLMK